MIKQNTQEWLDFRKTKIGASDAPIIMGDNKYKTPYQLWEEKLGISESAPPNYAMQKGIDLEPIAREAYTRQTGIAVEPQVVVHPEYEYMIASLDGLSECGNYAVEIKCAGEIDHQTAKEGKVPQHYFAQVQHQLACKKLNTLHYYSFYIKDWERLFDETDEAYRDRIILEADKVLIEVERDDDYIAKMMIEEASFYKKMRTFEPPSLSDKDYVERLDTAWSSNAYGLAQVQEELKLLKEKEKEYRENLIKLSDGQNSFGAGVRLQKVIRKGTVDYSSIAELKNVNLEEYRKSPVESWRITCK